MTEEQLRLFNKFRPLVFKYAKKYGKYDYKEVLQEGFLALVKAVKNYDSSYGDQHTTYISKYVKWEMYRAIDRQGKRQYYEKDVYTEEFYEDEDDYESKMILDDILKNTKLSKMERKVLNLILDDNGVEQMAKKINISQGYIRTIRGRLINKLKKTAKKRGFINE